MADTSQSIVLHLRDILLVLRYSIPMYSSGKIVSGDIISTKCQLSPDNTCQDCVALGPDVATSYMGCLALQGHIVY